MNWVTRLIGEMVDQGWVIRPGEGPDEYVVEEVRDHAQEHPVLLRVDPVALERYISATAEDATMFYPGVDPMEAGYRLTTIHLDEFILSDLPPMQEVWFEDDDIKSTPVEGWQHPLKGVPKGDYRWTTTRPDPDGIVRERRRR
jgi:hypothetical protein